MAPNCPIWGISPAVGGGQFAFVICPKCPASLTYELNLPVSCDYRIASPEATVGIKGGGLGHYVGAAAGQFRKRSVRRWGKYTNIRKSLRKSSINTPYDRVVAPFFSFINRSQKAPSEMGGVQFI